MSVNKVGVFLIVSVVACLATIGLYTYTWNKSDLMNRPAEPKQIVKEDVVRFIPIGDSYTIGLGVSDPDDRWPNMLVESLGKEGISLELVVNPAVSGYETDDAIARELPVFEKENPDLGILFIGANDAFRQKNLDQFKNEYQQLVDRMQNALTEKQSLILITIPNYAQFPAGLRYGATESEEKIIEGYNSIIREEAEERNLKLVDLYKINSMNSQDYFISDGIHPNPKGIKVWHDAILPVVRELLTI